MHPERVRFLKNGRLGEGPVLYWMSRDQRSHDNRALLCAQETALEKNSPYWWTSPKIRPPNT